MGDALDKIEAMLRHQATAGGLPERTEWLDALRALRAERDALIKVAERFRSWTDTKPHTVEESDALHDACEALAEYDAWKAGKR